MVSVTIKQPHREQPLETIFPGNIHAQETGKTKRLPSQLMGLQDSPEEMTPGKNSVTTFVGPGRDAETNRSFRGQAEAQPGQEKSLDGTQVIRVMLVDDHRIVREGLRSLIHAEPDMRVVAEAGDGGSAIELIERTDVDVVVMDVTMTGMNGVEATHELLRRKPTARVIGLSMHDEIGMEKAMQRAGAAAYVPKDRPHHELIDAIRRGMRERSEQGNR